MAAASEATVPSLRTRDRGPVDPGGPHGVLGLAAVPEWCGHQIEGIPVPDVDGRRQLVIEGEARSPRADPKVSLTPPRPQD
jgi:hypothetical protein